MSPARRLDARANARRRGGPLAILAALLSVSVPAPTVAVPGDADCSGRVTAGDLPATVAAIFRPGPCADADVSGDGTIRASDVTAEVLLFSQLAQRPAFDQVLDQIEPDGTISLATARAMFQLAYGGLDGVTPPAGALDTNRDGTIALAAMLEHQDELSAADMARLNQVLNLDGPVSATVPLRGPTPMGQGIVRTDAAAAYLVSPPPNDDMVADVVARIEYWEPQMEAFAGVPLAVPSNTDQPLRVDVIVNDYYNPNAVADTTTVDANGQDGEPVSCRINFYKGTFSNRKTGVSTPVSDRDNTVVHELWHCFEVVIVGDRATAFAESQWISEGEAEYVAAYLTKTQSLPFSTYLSLSAYPLFGRAYSAVGFYVTMENDGTDMPAALKIILNTGSGSNELAFDFGARDTTPSLLDTWGEREFEDTTHGGDWDYLVATGLPPPASNDIPGAVHLDMSDGALEVVQVPAYSVFLWNVNLSTDLVHFQIAGKARALDEAGDEFNDLSDTWLCAHSDPEQCKCPDGSEGMAPQSQPEMGPLKVAASAGDDPISGSMGSISLDQLCRQMPTPTPSPFCADAQGLQKAINQYGGRGLDPPTLQALLTADVYWLGLMAQDAPADISAAMQPVAAAYVTANTDFASIGYTVVPMSKQDELTIQAALQAVTAVAAQSQEVGAYVARVCGFQFTINGI